MAAPNILGRFPALSGGGLLPRLTGRSFTRAASTAGVTVPQAFDVLFTAVEMTEAERTKAAEQQKRVRAKLDAELTLRASYLSGSYRRRTLIRPVDDIDLIIVLDWAAYHETITLDGAGVTAMLDLVERALRKAYPFSEIKRWGRCIQVQFAGTGIGFDVVPAFQLNDDDEFLIPDEDRGCWVSTNPREVERLVTEANAATDGWLVPLVKLAKAVKDHLKVPIRGYHLEALVYHSLKSAPANERVGLAELFERLSTNVLLDTLDIWPSGESPSSNVPVDLRRTISNGFSAAAQAARRGIKAEDEGLTEDAHAIWYGLFGGRYPESGEAKSARVMTFKDAVNALRGSAVIGASSRGLAYPSSTHDSTRSSTSHGGPEVLEWSPARESIAGGDEDQRPSDVALAHVRHLECQIDNALRQFDALARVDPAVAAADPELWPVLPGEVQTLYTVLVGEQQTAFGQSRRILVKVPLDMPATKPRIYRLDRDGRLTGPVGRNTTRRRRRHEWPDGAMCTHAQRDRWDGRLVTLLIYAADWLFRQEVYQRTGRWIGREIGPGGRLLINGVPQTPGGRGHRLGSGVRRRR